MNEKVDSALEKNQENKVVFAAAVMPGLRLLEGRWKLVILCHLLEHKVLCLPRLERAIPDISQALLLHQLRQLERDGLIWRTIHPKAEYGLTEWGQALCPALDALLTWAAQREVTSQATE